MASRITRMVDGKIIPTRSVIIAFEDELPREVFVHLRRYRIELYVPKRGATCAKPLNARPHHVRQRQRFSPAARRRNITTSAVQSTRSMHAKCANCGENHNAADRGCIKYRTIDRALIISVKQGISYRDAVTQVKVWYSRV